MTVSLVFWVGLPFFCVGLIFNSKNSFALGIGLAALIQVWIWGTALSRFKKDLRASPVEKSGALAMSLSRIQAQASSRYGIEVFTFPSPTPRVELWSRSRNSQLIFISQGTLSALTEAELGKLYEQGLGLQKNASQRLALSVLQEKGRMSQILGKMKGRANTFRYWFFSFWLLPFEKTLNYAAHLL